MNALGSSEHVDFSILSKAKRGFAPASRSLVGHVPTIAITPVADGRTGAYESNVAGTWRMAEKVSRLIRHHVKLPDGTPVRVVVAPEIVYGPRTGARAQEVFTREGVSANIWVSRSWSYSDELMSACQGLGSSEWLQAAYGLNQTNRPGAVWLKAFCAAMDEKMRPIFSIYNPDLEAEEGDLPPYVAERILRFARCAAAVAEMRGKNYLSLGGVSMGIIGYLRKKLPMVERALLIIVAFAMVISPIGWSIPGLAPLFAGILMILHHLRVTRGPARKSEASVWA